MNRIVRLKAEQIARLVLQGVPMTRIAVEMHMSYDGLNRISRTPEYLEIEADVKANILGVMDARLQKRADLRQAMSDEMEDDAVPEAFKIVVESLKKRRDLKTALEVLDRDPKKQFARSASAAQSQQAANASQSPSGAYRPPIDSTALAQAVKEADITHTLIEKEKLKQPPANA